MKEKLITNFAFSAFLFSTFGWILLETELAKNGAHLRAHLLASFLGLSLSALGFRRCKLWWPSFADTRTAAKPGQDRFGHAVWISCAALLAIGAALGSALKMGSIFVFFLCAGGLNLLPWTKINFGRLHYCVSWALLAAGAASVLLTSTGSRMPFLYLLSAWGLWTIAVADLLVTYRGANGPPLRPAPASKAHAPGSTSAQPVDTLR